MENNTVAQKLEALVKLQAIDSELDSIKKLRGDLPDEVQDLEDEVEGYKTRLARFINDLEELDQKIKDHKTSIKESEKLIQKYEAQQMNVRNNREYDAISKEVELQQLEIQIMEKKIREAHEAIDRKKEEIEATEQLVSERSADLDSKKKELDEILNESKEEEEKLMNERAKACKKIEDKLLKYYEKLRKNLSNGLAVVSVKRGAAEGCNIVIPPQKIAEIREKKKIVIDEHSGRILADVDMESLEDETKKRTTRRKKKETK
ncbi:zinc ribbon domain-containing protein [Fulvivirga sedimenti]|uniref:C4-type zinc ribbon domain-containing protein n=1 Tax=Fulvivirga sedimenti TaxID=2879465 RepID=A0A9X1HM10_9BACT|nr:C4-type zinc ribbon domain-containing protein [Fulvivirga sedimenti]MCA6073298.1 C4-type zinc ribbon domain-containing protein [Fulvivirga sedimenti]